MNSNGDYRRTLNLFRAARSRSLRLGVAFVLRPKPPECAEVGDEEGELDASFLSVGEVIV